MKAIIFLILIVLSIASADKVIELTDSNFDTEVAKHDYLLIEFYAPWCGHCKSLAPEYEKAAEVLSQLETPLYLAKVDCTANQAINDRFHIEGFPTLKLYFKGEYIDYNAGRKADDIIAWYVKKVGPPSKEVNTLEEVKELASRHDSLIVYYGPNNESLEVFKKISITFETFFFANCSSEECKNTRSRVTIYKKYDDEELSLDASFTEESLKKFIEDNLYPLVSDASDSILEYIFSNNKKVMLYFKEKGDDEFIDIIKRLSTAYKGKMYFVLATRGDELTDHLAEYYGINDSKYPIIRLTNVLSDEKVFHYENLGQFNSEDLKKTLDDFLEGKLKQFVKSEAIPTLQNEAVYKVVGETFSDDVINNEKNVLVEFYAPWCGHCQKLAPEYEKLAFVFSTVENLRIAKIDATANDIDVQIEGYPTIKFYPAGDKSNPINYEGELDFNTLRLFLNEKLGVIVEDIDTYIPKDLPKDQNAGRDEL